MNDLSRMLNDDRAEAAREAATYMRALSNPSRMLLLCEMMDGKKSVGELEEALGLGQAYVSQQLARLRSDGFVKAERQGRVVNYTLADSRVRPLIEMIYELFCGPQNVSN